MIGALIVRTVCDHPYRPGCVECRRVARERKRAQRARQPFKIERALPPGLREEVVDLGFGRKERRLYRGPLLVERRPIEAPGVKPVAQTVRARGRSRGSL